MLHAHHLAQACDEGDADAEFVDGGFCTVVCDALIASEDYDGVIVLTAVTQCREYFAGMGIYHLNGVEVMCEVGADCRGVRHVTGPEIKQNVTNDMVSLIDILPTCLDYAGIDVPENIQGTTLRPILENRPNAKGRELIFAAHSAHGPQRESFYPSRSVRNNRFKYIKNLMPEKTYSLPADLKTPGKPWFNKAYQPVIENKDKFPRQYQLYLSTLKRPPEELYDLHTDPPRTK